MVPAKRNAYIEAVIHAVLKPPPTHFRSDAGVVGKHAGKVFTISGDGVQFVPSIDPEHFDVGMVHDGIADQHSMAGRAPSRVRITRTVPPGRSVEVRG